MSNINLKVEFMAGTTIEEAISEAAQLTKRLDIAFTEFNFNGINCAVSKSPNISKLVMDFHLACKSDLKFICG